MQNDNHNDFINEYKMSRNMELYSDISQGPKSKLEG